MDFAIAWLRERSGLPATNDFTMSPLHVDDYTELNAYFYEDVLGDVATECRFLKPNDPVPVALDFLEQRKEGDEEQHVSRYNLQYYCIVHRSVHLGNGRVAVEFEAVGEGSLFYDDVPVDSFFYEGLPLTFRYGSLPYSG